MARNHRKPVAFVPTGALAVLIAPTFKAVADGEKARVHGLWDFVRQYLLLSADRLGVGFTPAMNSSREVVKDLAFTMFKLHDAGNVEGAWKLGFIITAVRNPGLGMKEAFAELSRRCSGGDKKAGKLVEYANFSGVAPIWIIQDQTTGEFRVETYAEAAMRNLRAIVKHSSQEVSDSYPAYRNSMIRNGFVVDAVGRRVAAKALAERQAAIPAKKTAGTPVVTKPASPVAPPKKREDKTVPGGLAGLGDALKKQGDEKNPKKK